MPDPTILLTVCHDYNSCQRPGPCWGTDRAPSSSHTHPSGPYKPELGAQAALQASRLACPRWPLLAAKQTGSSGPMSLSRWHVSAGRAELPTETGANSGLGLGTAPEHWLPCASDCLDDTWGPPASLRPSGPVHSFSLASGSP